MRVALLSLLAALAPSAASACAVCFGSGETRAFQGLTWGLFVLLGATFSILSVLVGAVWRIEKHRESLALRGGHEPRV